MTDFDGEIIKKLWEILEEEDSDFVGLVDPANRIKLITASEDEENEGVSELKTGWNDNDFPEVVIYIAGRNDAMWSQSRAYGRGARDVVVDITINAVIEVVHANMNPYKQRELDDAITTQIRAAGPQLGITSFGVFPVGPMTRRQNSTSGRAGEMSNAGKIRRFTTTHTLTVVVKTNSVQLLPEE